MSHVVTVKTEIKDLECLKRAAARIGMEFLEGQRAYKWFGSYVGDSPLPVGFREEDLGKCEHAIAIPGKKDAYEVGVVRTQTGYALLYDCWTGGYGLVDKVGREAHRLTQAYGVEVASDRLRSMGFSFSEETDGQGNVTLNAELFS